MGKEDFRFLAIIIACVIVLFGCVIGMFTAGEGQPYKHYLPTRTPYPAISPLSTPRPPCIGTNEAQCFGRP